MKFYKQLASLKLIYLMYLASFLLALSFVGSSSAQAATFANGNEFEVGEVVEIFGDNFGSYSSLYSAVCFQDKSNCYDSFLLSSDWEWSNSRISFTVPRGVPISGELIIVGAGEEEICYEYLGYCSTYPTSEDKAHLTYRLKPTITSTIPGFVAKPGDRVRIEGYGFGDEGGAVFFGSQRAPIINWSDEAIDAEVPKKLDETQSQLLLRNRSGLEATTELITTSGVSNDPLSGFQTYLEQIDLQRAWQKAGDSQVTVAVLDDGVYINHPDLAGRLWRNYSEIEGNGLDDDSNGFIDDVLGYNFVDNSAFMDVKGKHGTMVASILGAQTDNGVGMTGVSKNVVIMPVIVADSSGADIVTLEEGIRYAVNNGADIINLSLASDRTIGFTQALNDAIQYAYINDVVVVTAAGNGDIEGGRGHNLNNIPQSPICNNNGFQSMLGVAALDNDDTQTSGKTKTFWSNYGSRCVNIAAPGKFIVGAAPPAFSTFHGDYDLESGTSFSAPMVAGIAALVKSKYPRLKNYEIIDRLISTSDDVDKENPSYEGQIGGRANAYRALTEPFPLAELKSVSPHTAKTGDKLTVKGAYFNSQMSIRLASQDAVYNLNSRDIYFNDAHSFVITIPQEILTDTYSIAINDKGKNIILEKAVTIKQVATEPQPKHEPVSPQVLGESIEIDQTLIERLKGRILLQVESRGEAWYIPIDQSYRYYMRDGAVAYEMLRNFGLGISNADLESIPVGIEDRFQDLDSDGDGLPDKLEEALSTDPENVDSDNDGFKDGDEVRNGYNPSGAGKLSANSALVGRLSGRILLQVESRGEAWYLNPVDGKRYYMKDGDAAYQIMRFLSLGITDNDLSKIPAGDIVFN